MSPGPLCFKHVLSNSKLEAIHRHAIIHFKFIKYPSQIQTVRYHRHAGDIPAYLVPSKIFQRDRLCFNRSLHQKYTHGHCSDTHFSDAHSTSPSDKKTSSLPPSNVVDVVSSYLSVRSFSSSLRELSADAYILIAKEAQARALQQIMDSLADDLLTHFPRESDREGFSKVVVNILSLATQDCPLTPQRTLELYNALILSGSTQWPPLSPKAWDRVFSAALMHPELRAFSLESFASMLLSEESQTGQTYARYTWIIYRLLIQLLMEGQESFPGAMTVFQDLLQSGRVPEDAQQLVENQNSSFKIALANILVRGCLSFNWHIRASEIILELLQDPRWLQAEGTSSEDIQATVILGLEVLHTVLTSPTRQEVYICRKLIRALLETSSAFPEVSPSQPAFRIPHADLHAFYEACHHYRFVGDAASVFVQLQSSKIRQHHFYPPPQYSALIWLFDHFADPGLSTKEGGERPAYKGYVRMARLILNDIIYREIPVPIVDRPKFITIAAARGFGFYARRLWEMYSAETDPDRDVVRGNAQMLIPMVKLFRRLQKAWDGGVDRQRAIESNRMEQQMIIPSSHDDSYRSMSHGATQHQDVQMTSVKRSILPDAQKFATRVLESYIATKQPLAMASQEDLNALARAHLILDQVREGLEALSIVSERGDIPDYKDVNVALGAIARYSPRRAADVLRFMVFRGVEPSASTFGALLHAALQNKDVTLVDYLFKKAKELGHGDLTPRAIAAMVQSVISFKHTGDEKQLLRQQSNLSVVMETIETIKSVPSMLKQNKDHNKDHVLSIKMGHKYIDAALTAMQPAVAFKFWTLLVKDRVLWEDPASRRTRALIGRQVREQLRQGGQHEEEWNAMLDELDVDDVREHVD